MALESGDDFVPAPLPRNDEQETIFAIRQAVEDIAHGRTRPLREALEELRRRHEMPAVKKRRYDKSF